MGPQIATVSRVVVTKKETPHNNHASLFPSTQRVGGMGMGTHAHDDGGRGSRAIDKDRRNRSERQATV